MSTSPNLPEQSTVPPTRATPAHASVALVIAGPGEPDLITVRGREALASADIIIADPDALPVANQHGTCCEVLPSTDDTGQPLGQTARIALIGRLVAQGKRVARLLSGDPVIDGSLRLETEALAAAGLTFEVAPGVSPLTGIPAFAGYGLTGGRVREVRVVDANDPLVDLGPHGAGRCTLVVVNGAGQVDALAERLVAAGWSAATPAAMTVAGGTADQRTVVAPLSEFAAALGAAGVAGQGMLVIGEVIGMREETPWFETKPLLGWRVLVPRTKEQAGDLSEQLRCYGAVPVEVPTISVEPPRTPQQMERAVHGLVAGRYEWVVFTSSNAVRAVCERFEQYGLDARSFAGLRIAAIGEQTAKALRSFGVVADLVPDGEQSSRGLLEVFPEYDESADPINRVFLPRADIATDTLVAGLAELGWEVDDITAYRTVRAAPPPAAIREAIKGGGFDAVLFTSSSTVRNLIGIAGKPHPGTVIACIGPATAATAEEHGLTVSVRPEKPSVAELAAALARYGEGLRQGAVASGSAVWRPSKLRPAARRRAN